MKQPTSQQIKPKAYLGKAVTPLAMGPRSSI